ncbi:helix-turn-helix domain-containing protein, partial [Micromonosporaceae bacterium Da 78-11]
MTPQVQPTEQPQRRANAEHFSERRRTAAEHFSEQLRALRTAVGNPSFRTMAGRSGRISHTTLHEAAAGTRFPSWETTREFVRACGSDEAQWRRRWEGEQWGDPAPVTAGGIEQPTDHSEPTPLAVPHVGDTAASSAVTQLAASPATETASTKVTHQALPRRWRGLLAGTTTLAVVTVLALTHNNIAAATQAISSAPASTAAVDLSVA